MAKRLHRQVTHLAVLAANYFVFKVKAIAIAAAENAAILNSGTIKESVMSIR